MELEVFSSMKVYGVTKDADDAQHGKIYRLTKQPGVKWPGSLAQPELLSRLSGKGFLLYPNIFEETSCIAAIEAQASGAVVITSAKAGLNETVVNGVTGVCLQGDPHSTSYQREFIETVCGLLSQPERMMEFSKNARQRAFRTYRWATIADEWFSIFEQMEPKVVTGRYSGPLCLLEKTHSYLNTGNVVAARRVLTELDRTPFFKKEAETLRQNCGL
jgi:glycosyltransferase involved in cell wall biosynthesis